MNDIDIAFQDRWRRRLNAKRADRDLNACLALRRQDAQYHAFSNQSTCLSLLEEWRWHWDHYLGQLTR